jgi:hypothetical protein
MRVGQLSKEKIVRVKKERNELRRVGNETFLNKFHRRIAVTTHIVSVFGGLGGRSG